MKRRIHTWRWAVVIVMLAMASVAPANADDGSESRELAVQAHVGTPAPVRMLPICEELPEGTTGACPTRSDFLTVQTSGSFGGVGVTITAVPSIPACDGWDDGLNIWAPSPCYSRVTFGNPGCVYLDEASGDLLQCPDLYLNSTLGSELSRESDTRYGSGEGPWPSCGANSNFPVYYNGGPANRTPDLTWAGVAPTTLECRMALDAMPDNLMGATWLVVGASIEVERSGQSGSYATASGYVTVNGLLGPGAPEPTTEDPPVPPDDPEIPEGEDDPFEPLGPFTDVPTGSYARGDIQLLLDLGITNGVNPTSYGPNGTVTRGQMAAFLGRTWRALGETCPDAEIPFGDVETSSFAYDEVACIFGLGITNGVSPTEYGPAAAVTREQMAAFLGRMWRALGNDCETGPTGFLDVPATSFAALDVQCIFYAGITKGVSATEFGPNLPVTREQMAAFLARLYRAHNA